MLFDIPFIADWNKIGDYRQHQADLSTALENNNLLTMTTKLVTEFCDTGWNPPQSTNPTWQRAMDYNDGSYNWNYQDSTRNKTGTNKYPENNTLH
jgi:hypothetical protein